MNKYHVMTLIVGLLTVCFSSNATLTVYAAESVSLSNVNSESQTESIDNFDLALYHQLETYVYKQKADGNLAFQWVYVLQPYYFADENGNIPEEFQNKVIIKYYSFEEEFLPQMQAFIQENSIDENMVAYYVLNDDTKSRPSEELVTAFTLLKQFVDEQTEDKNPVFHSASVWYYCLESDDDGNVPDFFQNKIVVTFYEFKQDEFMPLIRAFMQENDIEEDLVAYSMLLSGEPDIEPAQTESVDNFDLALYHQLETYVYKQKADGNLAFQWVYVLQPYYFADENGNIPEEFQNKVIIRYYSFEEEFLPQMQAFIQENSIDEGMVAYNVLDDDTKCRPSEELVNAFALLNQFIKEQKGNKNQAFYYSSVAYYCLYADEDGNIPEPFQNKIVVEGYDAYDYREILLSSVKNFINDNDIDENLVTYSFLENGTSDIEPVEKDEEILSDKTICEWAAKDYQNKTGTTVLAEITAKSDDAYEITLTNDNGSVLDTYKVNPATGIGTDSAENEVNLPQTGNNRIETLLILLCALLMAGFGWLSILKSGIMQAKATK